MKQLWTMGAAALAVAVGSAPLASAENQTVSMTEATSCRVAITGGSPTVTVTIAGSGSNAFAVDVDCNTEFSFTTQTTQMTNALPIQYDATDFAAVIDISAVNVGSTPPFVLTPGSNTDVAGDYVAQKGMALVSFTATVPGGLPLVAGSYSAEFNLLIQPAL